MPRWKNFLFAISWFFFFSFSLCADEGMWPFNQLPLDVLEKLYGFKPSQEWIKNIMLSTVRLNSGGSGALISSDGLVLTNYHIAEPHIKKLSSKKNDLVKSGFLATTLEQELLIPGIEFNILKSIEDVTERVNSRIKNIQALEESQKARRSVIAEIELESLNKTGLRSNVVTLYQGGQYHLYRYQIYTDIRLFFAPEQSAAFFGGESDNFEFPRYCLDMALFRIYENGLPLKNAHYLPWSVEGVSEGDLVFVSGNPDYTDRLLTTDALVFERDHALPFQLNVLQHLENALTSFGKRNRESTRRVTNELSSVQNQHKRLSAQLLALQNPLVFKKKLDTENSLKEALRAQSQHLTLNAWDKIGAARKEYALFYRKFQLIEAGKGFNSSLFYIARDIVRLVEEDSKPNSERLEEYQISERESLLHELYSDAPIHADLEESKLAASLKLLAEELGRKDPFVCLVMEDKSEHQRARELVKGTQLFDSNYRKKLVAGGKPAVQNSKDPFLNLALAIDKQARALREKYEVHVQEPEVQAYTKIAQAIFATYSKNQYPDATFTPRLAFGVVKSFEQAGVEVAPFTTFGGAFNHEKAHQAMAPWALPQSWHEAKASLTLDTPLNFVSSADTISGNSGSPVINIKGELVGLNFDGNKAKIPNNYYYDGNTMRHIAVDCRGMLLAMEKVYKAQELIKLSETDK